MKALHSGDSSGTHLLLLLPTVNFNENEIVVQAIDTTRRGWLISAVVYSIFRLLAEIPGKVLFVTI